MGKKGFLLPLLSVLVLASLISLPVARAQLSAMSIEMPTAEDVMKSILIFLFGSEFPDEWLTYSGFMQNIIFPFIAVFVVMYGILSEIRIFHNANVKAVLSLVMAFVGGTLVLQEMRWFLFANALWGTFGWGILMITGIALWIFRGVSENVGMGYKSYKSVAGMVKRDTDRKTQMDKLILKIDEDRVAFAEATGRAKNDWNNRLNADIAQLNRLMEEEKSEAH
jgi:hypothetical protein